MTTTHTGLPHRAGAPVLEKASLPARSRLGLKPENFRGILEILPDLGFFKNYAENYMVDGDPFRHYLSAIRSHYPLSIHGVGLSIGTEGPLDADRLDVLIERSQPHSYSEHLAWSTHNEVFLNDLLPVPYDAQTLTRDLRSY